VHTFGRSEMGGPNDKAHAHYSFVAAAILLLAVSWHVSTGPSTLASGSLEFTSAIHVLEEAAAMPLPDISLMIVVGPRLPPPRDDAWASLVQPWPQHVRLSSARHWDSAYDQDLPASPEEAVKREFNSGESVPGTFELITVCWPSLQPESRPELVLGSNRRAWAFLPCEGPSTSISSAVAAVGRALGASAFKDSYATHCENELLCLKPTARGGAQPYHVAAFELAVESPSSISRWPFGAAAAAFLNPALKRLEPALRLRATSRVTLTASIATRPLELNAPVKEELSIEGALPADSTSGAVSGQDERTPSSKRAATLGNLASAIVHGAASSLAPRDQVVGEESLMYTVAVLPESKQPQLVFPNSKRSGAKTSSTVQESSATPLNSSISSMLHVDDRCSTTVIVFRPLDDLPSNGSHPSPSGLPAEYLAPLFSAFLGRLRSGLGLPPENKCLPEGVDADVLISCSPLVEGFRGWEVDLLARGVLKRYPP